MVLQMLSLWIRNEIRMPVPATHIQHRTESPNQNYAREKHKPFTQEMVSNITLLQMTGHIHALTINK